MTQIHTNLPFLSCLDSPKASSTSQIQDDCGWFSELVEREAATAAAHEHMVPDMPDVDSATLVSQRPEDIAYISRRALVCFTGSGISGGSLRHSSSAK